jgi:uncharacterized protein (DUF305 family)
MKQLTRLLLCVAFIGVGHAIAEEIKSMDHMHMDHSGTNIGDPSANAASSQAFKAADQKMHENMAMSFTGNADVDFVKGMIPHHQGAIDMAKVELAYGKDPEIQKLAENVIKAQEAEIAEMNAWLTKHAK